MKKHFYEEDLQEDESRGGIRKILSRKKAAAQIVPAEPPDGQLSVYDYLNGTQPEKKQPVHVPVYVPKKGEYRTIKKQLKIDPAVYAKAKKAAQADDVSVNEYLNRILIAAVNSDEDIERTTKPGVKSRRLMLMLTPSLCKAAERTAEEKGVSFNELIAWAAEFPERVKKE